MSEFVASIKAIIEKVNLIVLLLSLAVSILLFKVWLHDLVWAAFAFCLAYPCIEGFQKMILYLNTKHKNIKKIKEDEAKQAKKNQEKEAHTKAHLCTIYESLQEESKKGLIMLYRLPIPDGGFYNSRILDMNNKEHILILNAIYTVESVIFNNHRLIERDNVLNKVVIIDADFYKVLEEKSKTFEM